VADDRLRVILFRAARELLVNAATHARASEAVLSIRSQDGLLRICVEDDGAGFDTAEAELRGYGLFGIREQLRQVGGSLQVESTPGRGTTVTLDAPLTAEIPAAT
jgi:signal transduction histidine kinase